MTTRQTIAAGATILAVGACARESRNTASRATASVVLACLSPDSTRFPRTLTFSNLRVSAATGDLAGFKFSFSPQPQEWAGQMWWAEGALGNPQTLSAVRFDPDSNALAFSRVDRGDTARFHGWLSCDSVWGLFVPFPTDTYDLTLRRDTTK